MDQARHFFGHLSTHGIIINDEIFLSLDWSCCLCSEPKKFSRKNILMKHLRNVHGKVGIIEAVANLTMFVNIDGRLLFRFGRGIISGSSWPVSIIRAIPPAIR